MVAPASRHFYPSIPARAAASVHLPKPFLPPPRLFREAFGTATEDLLAELFRHLVFLSEESADGRAVFEIVLAADRT